VSLIGDEDDVAALGEGFVLAAPLLGGEFLDGGEDDAAGGHLQLGLEVGPVFRLLGSLPQQILAFGEGGVELVIQVVAVGEHHQGRVGQGRMLDDFTGVEGHGEAFARPLGMPDYPRPLVALDRGGADGGFYGFVDGVVLVVARHFFGEGFAVALEDGEVADQVEVAVGVEDAGEEGFEGIGGGWVSG
jgi:hypothetical protein